MARQGVLLDDNGEEFYPITANEFNVIVSKTDIGVGADLPANTIYMVFE